MDRARPRHPDAAARDLGPLPRAAARPQEGVDPTLRRFLAYVEKHYGLSRLFEEGLKEGRRRPQIGLPDVARAVFLLFAQRLPSLNALEEVLRRRGRPLVAEAAPSADTIGYAYARALSDGFRAVLARIVRRARRAKALQAKGALLPWTVAVDGHELFASFQRSCKECLERRVRVGEEEKVQYYHRVVVAQLVGVEPPVCLDGEMIRPGEGEDVAALRLLERVLRDFPFVEVFTFDGLYLRATILRPILAAGRGAIVVLKEERRDLYKDVRGLCDLEPAREGRLGGQRIGYWDVAGLRSWEGMEDVAVRVVRTVLSRKVRRRIAGAWVESEETQDWTWATVGLGPEVGALTIHLLGHARWQIENRGFNEQDRFYALDHCFKHEPHAILNFLLTLFPAVALVELFLTRNLKAPALRGMTVSGLARLLVERAPGPGEPSIWLAARAP